MRALMAIVAAASVVSVACAAADKRTLIRQNTEARGGVTATQAVRGVELSLDLVEPKFALQAIYVANRNKCMRIDIFAGDKYLQSEGVSADGGWQMTAGKPPEPQPEGGTATLLHGIYSPVRMIGLNEFSRFGHKVMASAPETIDGKRYDKLTATYADGYSADIYLDATSHLIARIREHKPMHLAIDCESASRRDPRYFAA